MKKDVIFWVGVKSDDEYLYEKHGGFKYLDISKECWTKWCSKNDVIFHHYEFQDLGNKDIRWNLPTWQRHFDVFRVLEEENIEYNKIAIIDGSSLIHPEAPNFFDLVPDTGLTAFRSLENLRWIAQGVAGYNNFFKGFEFDLTKYFSCGFTIFTEEHKVFLEKLKTLYKDYYTAIMKLQNEDVKRGTDQPVYNYLAQVEGIKVNLDVLPKKFMITHLTRFDWMGHNWQLQKEDEPIIPHFVKHGYIWFFSGMANREARYEMMKSTWELIKGGYE